MKKLLGIIFLGLVFCGIGFTEEIEINCSMSKITNNIRSLDDAVRFSFRNKTIKLLVNTDEMKIYDNSDDLDLEIVHGIQNSVNIKEGISTSAFKYLDNKFIKEDFDIKLAIVDGTPNKPKELLLNYKKEFFKYSGTENYMSVVLTQDYRGFKEGTKISFEDVIKFTESEFFEIPIEDFYNEKLNKIKKKYKNDLTNSEWGDNIKNESINSKWKDNIKNKDYYDKIYNYYSIVKLNENSKFLYRGHVYWGGTQKKGFVVDILDMSPRKKHYPSTHPFYYYKQKNTFSFQFKLDYFNYCE